MFDLSTVQAALRDQQLDVRLLCGFRGLNVFAARVAGTSPEPSRRWAYHIPAQGSPSPLNRRPSTSSRETTRRST